jgi:uncharacterized protein (TIGR00270 family)
MSGCELCGKKDAKFSCEIEGTMMKVCEDCSKFGKVKGKSQTRIVITEKKKPEVKESIYIFLPGFGALIKGARERLGLKQEEFAKKLNLRESLLHQMESEHFKPDVETAKRLEKALHIKIMEEVKDEEDNGKSSNTKKSEGLTFGDMMKIKN